MKIGTLRWELTHFGKSVNIFFTKKQKFCLKNAKIRQNFEDGHPVLTINQAKKFFLEKNGNKKFVMNFNWQNAEKKNVVKD